jgi:hypothetical protein
MKPDLAPALASLLETVSDRPRVLSAILRRRRLTGRKKWEPNETRPYTPRDGMAEASRSRRVYVTRLDPPPADPRLAHSQDASGMVSTESV